MKQLVILILFLSSITLNGQVKELKKLNKRDILLKITPTSILDPSFPKIEFGASYIIADNLGFQIRFGQKIDINNRTDTFRKDGYKFSMEYQYFIHRKFYVAMENGILRNKITDKMTYQISISDTTLVEDTFHALNEKVFAVGKFGYIVFITNHLLLDTYVGIGLEYHQRTIENLEFDPASGNLDAVNFYEWFGPKYTQKRDPGIRLTFGLNINWRLK